MLLIFHRFASCYVVDQLVSIISRSAFAINLVWRLFTFYTFFVTDGKRAPTIVGRGSSPRSRTGCDIFSFQQSRGLLPRKFFNRPTLISILYNHVDCFCAKVPTLSSPIGFNLMRSYRPRRLHLSDSFHLGAVISILCFLSFNLCSCVGSFIARERTSHHNGFNLMQPCRLRCIGFNFAITSAISILCSRVGYVFRSVALLVMQQIISILCSRVGYVGNSAQRLHFLHNVALCILLSFGAVMVVCC